MGEELDRALEGIEQVQASINFELNALKKIVGRISPDPAAVEGLVKALKCIASRGCKHEDVIFHKTACIDDCKFNYLCDNCLACKALEKWEKK